MYRIVHYLNQFAAGLGGEARADLPPRWMDGPAGPGRLLQTTLGSAGAVVGTVVCGDDYAATRGSEALPAIVALVRAAGAHAVVAGPAFGAGRYGVACSTVCEACREQLGIPAITAMHPENPGVHAARPTLIVPAAPVADMRRATLALVTSGGIVPKGNPDRLESRRASRGSGTRSPGGRISAPTSSNASTAASTARTPTRTPTA